MKPCHCWVSYLGMGSSALLTGGSVSSLGLSLSRAGQGLLLRPGQDKTQGPCQNIMFSCSFFLLGTVQRRERSLHPFISVIKLRYTTILLSACKWEHLSELASIIPGYFLASWSGTWSLFSQPVCKQIHCMTCLGTFARYSLPVWLFIHRCVTRWIKLLGSYFTITRFKDWTPACAVSTPVCMAWWVQHIPLTKNVTQITLCCCCFP